MADSENGPDTDRVATDSYQTRRVISGSSASSGSVVICASAVSTSACAFCMSAPCSNSSRIDALPSRA